MEILNAFVGKKEQPSPEEIVAAVGPAAGLWKELIESLSDKFGGLTEEWSGYCAHKYGWSMKLKLKKRTVVHMAPYRGSFLVAFILGDKALAAAKDSKLPKKIQEALATAPRYPEGNGVRLVVKTASDLAPIRKLAEIKLAN